MKRNVLFSLYALVALILVAATACGGSEPSQPAVQPTSVPQPTAEPTSAPVTGGALDFSQPPTFGEQSLSAGFVPDPFEVSLISGGSVDATSLGGGCNGYAATAPDFRLRWDGSSARLRIMFVAATAGEDTTLIINAADGSWHCNDDSGGLNPMVEFANPVAGQYDIWVGSYGAGTYVSGTLRITELDLMP